MKRAMLLSVLILITVFVQGRFSPQVQDLYEELVYRGVKHPEIVITQIVQETGWLRSKLCKEGKNLFGMSYTKHKQVKGRFKKTNYARYQNWDSSISDYARWQRKYYKSGDYIAFLKKRGYAEDKNYYKKLKRLRGCITVYYKVPMIIKIEQLRKDQAQVKLDIEYAWREVQNANLHTPQSKVEATAQQLKQLERREQEIIAEILRIENEYTKEMTMEYKKQYPYAYKVSEERVFDKLNRKYTA